MVTSLVGVFGKACFFQKPVFSIGLRLGSVYKVSILSFKNKLS
jgi:hypothetical protein